MTLALRPVTPEDAADVQAIFQAAVAATGAQYSADQRRAWAAGLADGATWRARLAGRDGVLAERDGTACGFMMLGDGGYLDLAFVHPDAARQGVGRTLHDAICALARTRGETAMTTHASLAARAFFEALGWTVIEEENVDRHGQTLRRFAMARSL